MRKTLCLLGVFVAMTSLSGQNRLHFYADVNHRHRICKTPVRGRKAVPLSNDIYNLSHEAFADPNGRCLLIHAIKDGNWHGIWELPLNGDLPRRLQPPGFKKIITGMPLVQKMA